MSNVAEDDDMPESEDEDDDEDASNPSVRMFNSRSISPRKHNRSRVSSIQRGSISKIKGTRKVAHTGLIVSSQVMRN